jgi:hypothetical protein
MRSAFSNADKELLANTSIEHDPFNLVIRSDDAQK